MPLQRQVGESRPAKTSFARDAVRVEQSEHAPQFVRTGKRCMALFLRGGPTLIRRCSGPLLSCQRGRPFLPRGRDVLLQSTVQRARIKVVAERSVRRYSRRFGTWPARCRTRLDWLHAEGGSRPFHSHGHLRVAGHSNVLDRGAYDHGPLARGTTSGSLIGSAARTGFTAPAV